MWRFNNLPEGIKVAWGDELQEIIKNSERIASQTFYRYPERKAKVKLTHKQIQERKQKELEAREYRLHRIKRIKFLRWKGLSLQKTGKLVGISGQLVRVALSRERNKATGKMISALNMAAHYIEKVLMDWEPDI